MTPKEKIEQATKNTTSSYRLGFTDGVSFAESELKQIAVNFANYYADMVMAAYNRDADVDLFDKFLAERSGNICCRCGELGATEKHGMCKKCIDFCQTK